MTRNLIAAKAWEISRREICRKCEFFASLDDNISKYEWNRCQKQEGDVDNFSRWDGKRCRDFKPGRG